ncbi:MAG TPA: carboxypeptidase regulatory-like domain-containing protein [Methylomirabilota bacterium]|nr:carboxypeptidase regulatory-like domain-containing protein [Methylomirabilota bacterium]
MSLLSKIPVRLHLLLAFLLIGSFQMAWVAPAKAQVSGATLSGLVTDEQGGPVANATISIKNAGTGVAREVTSNTDGIYSAPNLLPGEYEVTVTATGFQTLTEKGITLTVGGQQSLNLVMKVGALSQTVEVNAAIPDIQTTSSTVSSTVDSTTIRELPLNGRDWTSLATLEPGVSSIPNQVGTGFSANKGNRGFGNQLSNDGHRANENTYRVNGISINDYSNGSPGGASGLNLGVDGIQEFSVLTSNYTAEYGRTSGAVINAITKSGVNDFHGTAFLFDRDKVFDAKNYFDPAGPISPFRRVQFGASGGTAIIKDKLFVYGTYEGVRQNKPGSQAIHVPTAAERALAVPSIAPYLALWPVAPSGTAVDANGVTQTFNVALPTISNENYYTLRVDQKFSDKNSLAVTYFFDSGPQTQPDPLLNAIHEVFSRRQMASVEDTYVFSPALVNTVRVGLSRIRGDINSPVSGDKVATDTALAVAPGAIGPPQIGVPGVLTTAIGLGGLNRFLHRWTSAQAYDDAFLTRGTHSIKIGFAFERMLYNITEQLSPNGRKNNYATLSDFLNNTPDTLNALAPGGSNEVAIRESLFAGYIHDDWRFRPNLTINLGLRYEFTTLPRDANNRIQEITTLVNCATPGVAPSPSSPCGPQHVDTFIRNNPTTKNFEPRVGFSWDPLKDGKTAVRGGFGIFDVLPLPYEFGLNTAATAPFQIIGLDKTNTLGSGIDPNISFNPNSIRNRYIDQNPHRADVLNWNFNIQRQLGAAWTLTAGYVGSRSVHLSVAADDINLVPPVQTSAGILIPSNTYQLDPNWGGANGGVVPGPPGGSGIRPVLFDGESSYNGFQAQLRREMSHGLQGQVSYTLGKCRDTSSAPVTGDTYVNSVAVPLLLSKAYRIGACDFDVRNTLVGTVIWDVPGPKSGLVSYALGGWQMGTIITATSGSPYTVTVGGGGDPLNTGFNGDFSMDFANLISGCNATPGVTTNAAGQLLAFNPNCFAAAPAVAGGVLVGNSGRNRFYGPGLTTVDFSLFKNFSFRERFKAQFRSEFFNILNHPNFAAPNFLNDANNSIGTGNAGVIGSTSTASRQIQLGLKLVW